MKVECPNCHKLNYYGPKDIKTTLGIRWIYCRNTICKDKEGRMTVLIIEETVKA